MKTVEFHGKSYQLPSDAKYIAYEYCGNVVASNNCLKRNYSDWDALDHGQYLDDVQWVIKIDDRVDLDKTLWHGSLTEI